MSSRNHYWKISPQIAVFLIAIAFLTTSCAGSLFKVKPVTQLPPLTGNIKTASAGGVEIRVAPLLADEDSQDLFEANLPLAGVLPVRMEMVFESGIPVETKRVRFRLRDGAGREWKMIPAKAAVARILKANDVFAYNPNSRKQFEKEFTAYAIDLKEPLSSSDRSRTGFLFFQSPKNELIESPRGLVLQIDGLPQPVQIPITDN